MTTRQSPGSSCAGRCGRLSRTCRGVSLFVAAWLCVAMALSTISQPLPLRAPGGHATLAADGDPSDGGPVDKLERGLTFDLGSLALSGPTHLERDPSLESDGVVWLLLDRVRPGHSPPLLRPPRLAG